MDMVASNVIIFPFLIVVILVLSVHCWWRASPKKVPREVPGIDAQTLSRGLGDILTMNPIGGTRRDSRV